MDDILYVLWYMLHFKHIGFHSPSQFLNLMRYEFVDTYWSQTSDGESCPQQPLSCQGKDYVQDCYSKLASHTKAFEA